MANFKSKELDKEKNEEQDKAKDKAKGKANRLINEKSPYLLQHAYNPVDWYPWSEEAFDKAKLENKPIFLSIGYSTCHWCHVMERESFENEQIAAYLNQHYVSIKVDREERPDVDHIYMTTCQAMTGSGGWPLSVFMTSDKHPFYTGTYFPPESKWGRPGFIDILKQLHEKWSDDPNQLLAVGERMVELVTPRFIEFEAGNISDRIINLAYKQFADDFDELYGGFAGAPKFPTPHNLMFLLRYWKDTGTDDALMMVEKTLDSMYRGGIYDHIGFGFARYSTDQQWLVPHFEKMLYDNALLAFTYLEAYQATKREEYRKIAEEILAYVMRDMMDANGGFYSAEDADSEGEEGKYYVWMPDQVEEILTKEEADLFCKVYDISECTNFENSNIPNLIHTSFVRVAHEYGIKQEQLFEQLDVLRQKLLAAREKRIKPHKDDKILASWNGLMIAAFAKAAQVLKKPIYKDVATKAIDFVMDNLRDGDGRLLARYRDGEAKYLAYIDDYAFMIWGLLEQYYATFDAKYLAEALELQKQQNKLFWDDANGGYYFYGSDGEKLISRPKEIYDGAIPSGNSVAAYNLVRLSKMTGDEDITNYADKIMNCFAGTIAEYPRAYGFFLIAMQFHLADIREIVIVGESNSIDTLKMLDSIRTRFLPYTVVIFRDEDENYSTTVGKTTAYICQNNNCLPPIYELKDVEKLLDDNIN